MSVFGDEVEFVITGAQTGGRFTQWIETTHPGGGPPPHYHTREDENFYVIEGSVEVFPGRAVDGGAAGDCGVYAEGRGACFPQRGKHAAENADHDGAVGL